MKTKKLRPKLLVENPVPALLGMYLVLEAMFFIMMLKMMNSKTLTFQNPSAQLYSAMAQLSPLTQYAELYVDSSRPSIQQAASVDAVAYLLKNDILTLEALVREMGMYLPTTDNIIRARDGLADWRAL